MKKRLIYILMILLTTALTLSIVGCSFNSIRKNKSAEYSFEYENCILSSAYSELWGELDFIYEDTSLYLFKDGTWKIEMDDFTAFVDGTIDEGTYTVNSEGLYTFSGFEYGFKTTGRRFGDEFEIYFKEPGGSIAFELHFED